MIKDVCIYLLTLLKMAFIGGTGLIVLGFIHYSISVVINNDKWFDDLLERIMR